MNRKQFLASILGVVAAPFIVKAVKEQYFNGPAKFNGEVILDGAFGNGGVIYEGCYWGHTDKPFDLEEFRRQVREEEDRLAKQMEANGNTKSPNITKWVSFEGKMSTHPLRWNKNKLA